MSTGFTNAKCLFLICHSISQLKLDDIKDEVKRHKKIHLHTETIKDFVFTFVLQ